MKYNALGNTGLKISEICLGTMTFGREGIFKDALDHSVYHGLERYASL